jgi:DNA-binding protein Fis
MALTATDFQFGPFAERFATLQSLYQDPGYELLRVKDRNTGDEVRLQLMHLHSPESARSLPLQWEALKACRDSLWVRPQEWLWEDPFGALVSWVPPGRPFHEVTGTLPDEVYVKWLKEALQDLVQLHRCGLLHLAQNEKTWILFKHEEDGEETMGLSEVPLLSEAPSGRRVGVAVVAAVPPELLRGQTLDVRADLYSLAALFLRQRSAHLFANLATMKENLELHWKGRLSEMVPDSATTFNDLLRKMLQADPKDRPENAQAALALLEPSGEGSSSSLREFPEWSAQRNRARQNTLILNSILTLIDGGENGLAQEMLDSLEGYLQKDHESYLRYLQARLARQMGQAEKAEEYRRQATVLCYTHPDRKLKSLLHLEEAHVQWGEEKFKEALVSLDESWEVIAQFPEPNLQIRILYERARLRKKLGEDDEALSELKQAFDRIPPNEMHPGKAPVYAELAELLSAYGCFRQARSLMDQALTHREENPQEAGRRSCQAALAAVAAQDWNRASEYFSAARSQFSFLKDLASLLWAGGHGVRLPLARGDWPQARRELKAMIHRNRRFHFHGDLMLLLELELWLESGQALRAAPEDLLDRIKHRAPGWLGKGCFCDLAWPQAKTSRLMERAYQKLKRYPEAMRFAAQAKKWEDAVTKIISALGYPKESLHPGPPSLVSVTAIKVETTSQEKSLETEVPTETHPEALGTIKAHAHYLESQIHHMEGVKESLLRDNIKLNREIEALKDQLAFTQAKESANKEKVQQKVPEEKDLPPVASPFRGVLGPQGRSPTTEEPKAVPEEHDQILQALTQFQGNRSQAAKALGMHRRTLFQKMKKYGLEELEFVPGREDIEAAMAQCNGNRSEAAKKLGMSRSGFYRRLKELGLG